MLVCAAILIATPAFGAEWLAFRGSQVSVFQSSGGNAFSGMLTWNPEFALTEDGSFKIVPSVGATMFKSSNETEGTFMAPEAMLNLDYRLNPEWSVEVGGGVQMWTNDAGSEHILAGAAGHRHFSEKFLSMIDRLFVAYSSHLVSGNMGHQIKVGAGVTF